MQIYPHCDGFLPKDNILVKATMCFCKSCFWCLEKFMKFLNRLEILPFVTLHYIYTEGPSYSILCTLENVVYIISGMPISYCILSQECLYHHDIYYLRNAYIMCAVKGTNFCSSAKEAFFLLLRFKQQILFFPPPL